MRTKAGVITDKNENIILDVDFIMYYIVINIIHFINLSKHFKIIMFY